MLSGGVYVPRPDGYVLRDDQVVDPPRMALQSPEHLVLSRSLRKIAAGDTNAGARNLVVISQSQGALIGVELVLFVAGIWQIVAALPAK